MLCYLVEDSNKMFHPKETDAKVSFPARGKLQEEWRDLFYRTAESEKADTQHPYG